MYLDENLINPQLLPFLRDMPALPERDISLADIRRALEARRPPVEHRDDVATEDRMIPGPDGAPDVLVRIYQPKEREPGQVLPAFLWIHGGGFFLGDVWSNDALCEKIVVDCGCVVVSVNYRLAPEHPFPAGLDDCHVALCWLAGAGEELSIDPASIAIGGASAGGCLAAALALFVRDEGGPAILYQVLMIPVIDDRHETSSSHLVHDQRVWHRAISLRAWSAYLAEVQGETPIYAAPGRAGDLSGLPSAFVSVEDQDLLRDEGIDYAQRLMQAGVLTELHVYPGTFHGSFGIPGIDVSRRHLADMRRALKHALRRSD